MNLTQVRAICEAAMREYGVPAPIRTDNGVPAAGTGLSTRGSINVAPLEPNAIPETECSATKGPVDQIRTGATGACASPASGRTRRAIHKHAKVTFICTELSLLAGEQREFRQISSPENRASRKQRGGNDEEWKAWGAMKSASHPFHSSWKSLWDSQISTSSTAVFDTSKTR